MHRESYGRILLLGSLLACGLVTPACGQEPWRIDLERPGQHQFVLDLADLIREQDEQQIRKLANHLLTDKAVPIVVVTISSMARHRGGGLPIETFAHLLFDQWGIGHKKIGDERWNYGILLLVSYHDRKARIQLGAGWRRDKDDLAQEIMDKLIVPRFQAGAFSAGIVSGVNALDKMARELSIPWPPRPTSHYVIGGTVAGLALLTIASFARSGTRGIGWQFWSTFFGMLGRAIIPWPRNRARSFQPGNYYPGDYFDRGYSGSRIGSHNYHHDFGHRMPWWRISQGSGNSGSSSRSSSHGGSRGSGGSGGSGGGHSGGSFGGGYSGGGGATGSW